ncbi:MAG TPA: hypothetical protein DCL61_20520 [Cyanobacteria bacterium UBA12227]|nr:hypothetical protein [Cyanobacteria bacterium UBA12227]HAX90075.1 hypothetical protein [Cyanobacteria bacterium UBA11370]HBY76556.1 hypothetical protein [Cyanobacteria bacterium UBA11148]
MPKTFSSLIVYFSLLLPTILFPGSVLADVKSPMLPNSEIDTPVCYMETVDGRILDLGYLCPSPPEEVTSPCNSDAAGMAISNVKYDGNSLTGQVTNRTCKMVKLVKINYEVLDGQGNPIDNGFIYTQPSEVSPGKTASFGGIVVPGAEVNVTYVEWSEG